MPSDRIIGRGRSLARFRGFGYTGRVDDKIELLVDGVPTPLSSLDPALRAKVEKRLAESLALRLVRAAGAKLRVNLKREQLDALTAAARSGATMRSGPPPGGGALLGPEPSSVPLGTLAVILGAVVSLALLLLRSGVFRR